MIKELEKLTHNQKLTGATTCFINQRQLFEKKNVRCTAVVLVKRPSWREKNPQVYDALLMVLYMS